MAKWLKDPFLISLILVFAVGGSLAWLRFNPIKKQAPLLLGEKAEKIDKIDIDYRGSKTVLRKENDQWKIETEENKTADQQLVADLINKLKILQLSNLVSENPDNHQKYGVDQTSAARLIVYQNGQKLVELLVGDAGPSFNGHYIRKHDDDNVYLSNTPLKTALVPSDSWAEVQEDAQEEN